MIKGCILFGTVAVPKDSKETKDYYERRRSVIVAVVFLFALDSYCGNLPYHRFSASPNQLVICRTLFGMRN